MHSNVSIMSASLWRDCESPLNAQFAITSLSAYI